MRWFLATLPLFPALALAEEPLQSRNHRPSALIFSRLPKLDGVVERNHTRTTWQIVGANEFRVGPGHTEDAETWRLIALHRQGIGEGVEAFVQVPLVSRGGGFLDPIIDWWHGLLGEPFPLRESTPEGRSLLRHPGSPAFGSATGLGDVTFGVGLDLGEGWTGRLALELPTGSRGDLIGNGGLDLSLGADRSWQLGPAWNLYAQAAINLQSTTSALPGERTLVEQATVAFSYAQSSKDRWFVQWDHEGAPVTTGISEFDEAHTLMTFGYRRRIDAKNSLDLWFSQDSNWDWVAFPGGANLGPDLTIGVAWRATP